MTNIKPFATSEQTRYFYQTLRQLVTDGDVPYEHVLKRLPDNPFSRGSGNKQHQKAIAQLERLAGGWSLKLRQLYYGYTHAGRASWNLRAGIAYTTMYDEELRAVLRSHPGDDRLFPSVFFPDEEREKAFMKKIREVAS